MNDRPPQTSLAAPAHRWAVVSLLLGLATACGFALEPHVSLTSLAMVYVLAVAVAAYKLDWIGSSVSAVAAVTALNFFFVPPRWTFEVESQEHFIALTAMLVVALAISHLATGLRRETDIARLNEQRARQLQALATELANAASPEQVLALGRSALEAGFAGPCVLALTQDDGCLDLPKDAEAMAHDGMVCCIREAAVLGPGTGRWPGLDAWFLPLGEKDHVAGAACVRPALSGDESGREYAQALCALLGQALWRLRLNAEMLQAQGEAHHQQLQSTFLAAISHDLRTPLAAVVGAASALLTQRDKLAPSEQERLLRSIASEAAYLSTVTENTLQLVRLSGPAQTLRRDWESLEEIVGAVLARVRQRDPSRRIKSSVPEGLPLLKADPVLLAQLIANLLDNALSYSEGPIELSVSAHAHALEVCVKDRGPGLSNAQQASLFAPHVRGDHPGVRGAGLGLAVCKAIAEAHGAQLTHRRRSGGGSRFSLMLPAESAQPPREAT
jgi:two-component system sensor histidine kinase KdpD